MAIVIAIGRVVEQAARNNSKCSANVQDGERGETIDLHHINVGYRYSTQPA
jgi:hypothetical protein